MKILISGGGIAGLTVAKLLQDGGMEVVVVDKAREFSNVGFLLGLKSFGMEIFQELGLLERLKNIAASNKSMSFIEPNGKLIRTIETEKTKQNGVDSIVVPRGGIHQVLYESIKNDVRFILGTTVKSVAQTEDSAIVTLSDGEVLDVDLLVVSEGLRSTIREQYFPVKSKLMDFNVFYLGGRLSRRHQFEVGANLTYIGINKMLSIYPVNDVELAIQCYIYSNETTSRLQSNAAQLVRESFRGFDDVAQKLINEIAERGMLFSDKMGMVRSSELSNGRIVLLGDAGYCPTALSGMGASLSILGAKALAHFLATSSNNLTEALVQYDQYMKPIVEKFQDNAGLNANAFLPKNKLRYLIFKLFFKYVPESVLLKKMTKQLLLTKQQKGILGK